MEILSILINRIKTNTINNISNKISYRITTNIMVIKTIDRTTDTSNSIKLRIAGNKGMHRWTLHCIKIFTRVFINRSKCLLNR